MGARTKGIAQIVVQGSVQASGLQGTTDTTIPGNSIGAATDRANNLVYLIAGTSYSVRWGWNDGGSVWGAGVGTNTVVGRCDLMAETTQTLLAVSAGSASDSVTHPGGAVQSDRTFSFTPSVTGTYRIKCNIVVTVTIGGAAVANDNTDNGNFGSATPARLLGATLSSFTPGLLAVGTTLNAPTRSPSLPLYPLRNPVITVQQTFPFAVGSGTSASAASTVSYRDTDGAGDVEFASRNIAATTSANKTDTGLAIDNTLPVAQCVLTDCGLHFSFNNSALSTALGGAGLPWSFISGTLPAGWTQVASHTIGATEIKIEDLFQIDPRIRAFKDSGLTQPGVASHQNSGRTITQDIFKRTGAVNTTNAVPFLSAYIMNAIELLTSAPMTVEVIRVSDSVVANTQSISTDANGRATWNYTIAATDPAFSTMVKAAFTRQTGSHVAAGPDSYVTPPATFSLGNGDGVAPFPGYPRNVRIVGNWAGSSGLSVTHTNVFGVSSEIKPNGIWSGPLASAALDANGVPTGAGSREQTLGSGSLKLKWSAAINEGNIKVTDLTDSCVKDIAGRDVDLAGAESIFLRRVEFNDTTDAVTDAGSSLSDAQTSLDTNAQFGYHSGANSLDTIAAPSDGSTIIYALGGADTNAQRITFALTLAGATPVIGFNGDTGNFGYRTQEVGFSAADLTLKCLVVCEVAQSDPGVDRRFTLKVARITPDDLIADAVADNAPLVAVFGQPETGSMVLIEYIAPTAIGAEPSAHWEFTHTIPSDYPAVKYFAIAKVSGSRTAGGSEATVQVGFEYDATGSLIKVLQSQ